MSEQTTTQKLEGVAFNLLDDFDKFLDWGLSFLSKYGWVVAVVLVLKSAKGVFGLKLGGR